MEVKPEPPIRSNRRHTPRRTSSRRNLEQEPYIAKYVPEHEQAGLARDGARLGVNKVGTWMNHVSIDIEATFRRVVTWKLTRGIEVDWSIGDRSYADFTKL